MEFEILGPLRVRAADGRVIALPGAKPRALLAMLLLHPNQPISTERLAVALWGEDVPATAVQTVQVHVSRLRRALGDGGLLDTTSAGYRLRVAPGELDAERFEDKLGEGRSELAAGDVERARNVLREALALWRGPALGDLADEPFAALEIARLEEQRLTALESRLEADLAAGLHAELTGELHRLASEHPWRERLHGQLMLALYRCGRQAEALDVYRRAREVLVEALGIEPGPELRELHRAILAHDPDLRGTIPRQDTPRPEAALPVTGAVGPRSSILVVPEPEADAGAVLSLAGRLAQRPPGEVVLANIVEREHELAEAARELDRHRRRLADAGVPVRAAAFTSSSPSDDLVLLGNEQQPGLVLLGAPRQLLRTGTPDTQLARVLDNMPCDVMLMASRGKDSLQLSADRPVVVPFGGAEHEWAAVEIAAWIASTYSARLKLLGTRADPVRGRRDASRLLARAALMVQRVAAVPTEPELIAPGPAGVLAAAETAGLLVIGLASHWRELGLGTTRLALLRDAVPPSALIRRGLRPGAVSPSGSFTRFTWTLTPGG
jgi:DNA-binding SARP family transcriptional activator